MNVDIKPIKVKYQGRKLVIDLQKELTINPSKLDSQLREIPSSYYIFCNLRDKYIRKRDELARQRDEAYSKAWTYYKDSNPSWNNDYVSNKANTNNKYVSLCNRHLMAAEKAAKFIAICRAYESKEGILRTMSANLRRQ